MVMEAFAVAAWRQLPSLHPVFKVLFPHLRSVMAINHLVRDQLAKSEASNKLLKLEKKSYKAFTFGILSVPSMMKERGVDDANKLPKYYYR